MPPFAPRPDRRPRAPHAHGRGTRSAPRAALACAVLLLAAAGCEQSTTPAALSIGDALICEEPSCFDGVDVTYAPRLGQDRKHRWACEHFWDDYDGPIPPEEQQPLQPLYDQNAPLTDKWCVTKDWRAQYE